MFRGKMCRSVWGDIKLGVVLVVWRVEMNG